MRKALLLGAATALAFAVSPASADVFVYATVDKTKDKTVEETLTKFKFVDVDVDVFVRAGKFAESEAILNQDNTGNTACENCAEKLDLIGSSVNDNTGITTLNQAGGNMNNQGNAISFAVDAENPNDPPNGDPGDPPGFAESNASASQFNDNNSIDSQQILFRDGFIRSSVNNNVGVTYVNQSVGNINNQANLLSVAAAMAPGVALAEADLGQFNADNSLFEDDVFKQAVITGSVNGNQGVTGVNQSSGTLANQANVTAIGAAGVSQ